MNNRYIIHRTIVALMSNLLQTDDKQILQEKLIFISNYIHLTIKNPKEKALAFIIVEETIKKDGENEDNASYKSIHTFLDLLKSKTFDDKSFPIRPKQSQNHVIKQNKILFKSHFSYEDTTKELSAHLNESQKKYVAYLLFHIAFLDNTINSSEWDTLKGICRNLLPSVNDINILYIAFQNGTYKDWFFDNIHAKDPDESYDPDNVVDFISKPNDKLPSHTHSFRITTCLCGFFSILLIISNTLLAGGIGIGQIIFYNLLLVTCIVLSYMCYNRHKTVAETFQIIVSYQEHKKNTDFLKKQYVIYMIGTFIYFFGVKTELKNEGDYLFKSVPERSWVKIYDGKEKTLAINRFQMEIYLDEDMKMKPCEITERQEKILNALGERMELSRSNFYTDTYSRINRGSIALKGNVEAEICRGYFGKNYYITLFHIDLEEE